MVDGLTLKRGRKPEDPGVAVIFFSLIAATGFAFGWAMQALGSF